MKNRELQKLLEKRTVDITTWSVQLFISRAHLTQVLLGQRKGAPTWKKLQKGVEAGVLTQEEYDCAKSYADAELKAREKDGKSNGAFAGTKKSAKKTKAKS